MKRIFCAAAALLLTLTACGDRVRTQSEDPEWELVEEEAAVLPDGTAVGLWRMEQVDRWNCYRLPDGTELLEERAPTGPANVVVGGVEGFGQLGEAAQAAIGAYYEDQGLRYDLQAELERAYADYQSCQRSGEAFEHYIAGQEVAPTASNDHIVCFVTTTTRSVRGRLVENDYFTAVFDRETGEPLDPVSLFTVSPEEVLERLLSEAQIYDSALREEMKAAWDPAWLELDSGSLSVYFPRGSLPSQETASGFGVDVEDVRDILHDWAVTQPPD